MKIKYTIPAPKQDSADDAPNNAWAEKGVSPSVGTSSEIKNNDKSASTSSAGAILPDSIVK